MRTENFQESFGTLKMKNSFMTPLLFCLIFQFCYPAKAETYFLKIEQSEQKDSKIFLQTCSPETAPCTFMMPITLGKKGGTKNIAVVMRFKESPYIYLQFLWDQVMLQPEDYMLIAGSVDQTVPPLTLSLYAPVPPDQKPSKNQPVLKSSDTLIASLKISATLTKE